MTRGLALGVLVGLCLSLGVASAHAAEARFSELFAGGSLGADVVVQVPDGTVLVVDGPGPYQLQGRNLIVHAREARIEGSPVIESYALDSTAPITEGTPPQAGTSTVSPLDGMKGLPGATGHSGANAGMCLLDIGALLAGDGTGLRISLHGQKGGKGQKGGQGGQGAIGPTGTNAKSDFPLCSAPCPGKGQIGFAGGQRGAGGQGGPGGQGGTVFASDTILALLAAGSPLIAVATPGGPPGDTGDLGERGLGGTGGSRGSGGNCLCSNPPGPGDTGPEGIDAADSTLPGEQGPDGSVQPL